MKMGLIKNLKFVAFLLAAVLTIVLLYSLVFRVDFGGSNPYIIQFGYIGTIMVGSPVRKSGVKIGSVSSIGINPEDQRTVFVGLALYDKQTIKTEDKVAIVSGGILGDQFIEIFPAPVDSPPVEPGVIIKGIESLDFRGLAVQGGTLLDELNLTAKYVNSFLSRNSAALNKIIDNTEVITNNLRTISEDGKRLGAVLNTLEKEITASAGILKTSVESLASRLETETSTAVKSLQGGLTEFNTMSIQLRELMTGLNRKDGLLEVIQRPETGLQLKKTMENIQVITQDISALTGSLKEALDGPPPAPKP